MAVLSDSSDNPKDDVQTRMDDIERMVYELSLAIEDVNIELTLQAIRSDSMTSLVQHELKRISDSQQTWQERLVYKHPAIVANHIWRGNVNTCFGKIYRDIDGNSSKEDLKQSYFGVTCDPERRIREHFRTLSNFSHVKRSDSQLQPPLYMNLLYRSSKMENAADMESRLLARFSGSRNAHGYSSGLLYGKPAYFVYLLGKRLFRK